MTNSEKGQALPLSILALALGTLVVTPFLGHASSSMIGSGVYERAMLEQYAVDAGVEHAVWSLTNGGLAAQLPLPGDSITYQLSEAVNGVAATVTITANVTAVGGTMGDMADATSDTLEFDNDAGYEPDIVHISGSVYAIAYRGPGDDGFLKTVAIASDGIINTVIDTLEFDTGSGYEPDIIHVSGNIYAIAYRGPGNDGFLKTVTIAPGGMIADTIIDSLEFDSDDGWEPDIVFISGSVHAIAYRGPGNDGFLKTVNISTDGTIADTVIDTLEFDAADGYEPDIVFISGSVYAIAYRGPGNDGFLKTVNISPDGMIADTVIDILEFDTAAGYEPDIIFISGNVYAISYQGPGSDGFLKTANISPDGTIADTVIDTLEFDAADGYEPDIVFISGGIYAIAYRGPGNDGFLKTVTITADGDIADVVIDTLEFDTSDGYDPDIVHISGNAYAIAYRGVNNDGFLKTVEIISQGAPASADYEIISRAGDTSIRAFVNIVSDNVSDTVTIVSWQIN